MTAELSHALYKSTPTPGWLCKTVDTLFPLQVITTKHAASPTFLCKQLTLYRDVIIYSLPFYTRLPQPQIYVVVIRLYSSHFHKFFLVRISHLSSSPKHFFIVRSTATKFGTTS